MQKFLNVRFSSNVFRRFSTVSFGPSATIELPTSPEYVDITIAGGGLVGSAMALALVSSPLLQNHRVVLLESQQKLPNVSSAQPFSNRVCALNTQSVNLFRKLGAWDLMRKIRVQKVSRMQVWDACSESMIHFDQINSNDDNSLAFIVENDVIQSCLLERLKQLNVEPRLTSKVKEFRSETDGIRVELQNEKTPLQTKLLIAADGYLSTIRDAAGITTMQWDYNQVGIVATLQFAENIENNVAWQRFLPTGPIACLPLSKTHSSLVWTVPTSMRERLLKMSNEEFVAEVNRAFTSEIHKQDSIVSLTDRFRSFWSQIVPTASTIPQFPPTVVNIEPKSRAAFPLSLLNANQYVRPRLVLVGDSAHRIHPMAGQGVNMGFADVQCLVEVLERAVRDGADFSSMTYLVDYERQRQIQSLTRLLSIDSLNRLYSTSFSPIVALRSVGLSFVNEFSPLKKFFAKQAAQST